MGGRMYKDFWLESSRNGLQASAKLITHKLDVPWPLKMGRLTIFWAPIRDRSCCVAKVSRTVVRETLCPPDRDSKELGDYYVSSIGSYLAHPDIVCIISSDLFSQILTTPQSRTKHRARLIATTLAQAALAQLRRL
jgi:hypothetical protein